jgi:hypothetical protein
MTARPAPTWADPPLDMEGAARALGISRRTLTESLKRLPYYELRGTKKVFYPEHITALRRGMHECACKSDGSTVGRMSAVPVPMAPVSAVLLELATLAKPKKPARN